MLGGIPTRSINGAREFDVLAPLPTRSSIASMRARTELTDRILIFGERHLRTVLARYAAHYNGRRPHRALHLRPPRPDHPAVALNSQRIRRRPVLRGLISKYERAA
jgi:putative transposase